MKTGQYEKNKKYLKEWREKNKDKIKKYNKRNRNTKEFKIKNKEYSKKFNLKYPEKRKKHLYNYNKKKFYCLFCNRTYKFKSKLKHIHSNKHKNNTNKFILAINKFIFKKKKKFYFC